MNLFRRLYQMKYRLDSPTVWEAARREAAAQLQTHEDGEVRRAAFAILNGESDTQVRIAAVGKGHRSVHADRVLEEAERWVFSLIDPRVQDAITHLSKVEIELRTYTSNDLKALLGLTENERRAVRDLADVVAERPTLFDIVLLSGRRFTELATQTLSAVWLTEAMVRLLAEDAGEDLDWTRERRSQVTGEFLEILGFEAWDALRHLRFVYRAPGVAMFRCTMLLQAACSEAVALQTEYDALRENWVKRIREVMHAESTERLPAGPGA